MPAWIRWVLPALALPVSLAASYTLLSSPAPEPWPKAAGQPATNEVARPTPTPPSPTPTADRATPTPVSTPQPANAAKPAPDAAPAPTEKKLRTTEDARREGRARSFARLIHIWVERHEEKRARETVDKLRDLGDSVHGIVEAARDAAKDPVERRLLEEIVGPAGR